MYSNKPYFSPETDGEGAVATTDDAAVAQEQTTETTIESTDNSGEAVTSVLDEEDNFDFDSDDAGSSAGGSTQAGTQAGQAQVAEEKVSKSEYEKVVAELNSLKQQNAQLKELFEQPIIKSGVEYLAAKGQGAEIDVAEYYEQTFGLDGNKLSDEDLIRFEIKKDAELIGTKIEGDDLDRELDARLAALENLSPLQKQRRQKELREMHSQQRKQKLEALVQEKIGNAKQEQEYWANQEAAIVKEVETLVKNGKKDSGLRMNFTQSEKDKVLAMVQSGFLKFDGNKNVNVKHVIETALFSADPQAYIKAVSDRAVERYKASELAKRSTGSALAPDNSAALGNESPKPKVIGKLNLKKVDPSTLNAKP